VSESFSLLSVLALGYASCFLSALHLVAGKEKIKLPGNVKCEAHVSIGPPSEGPKPFAIAVDLIVTSDAKEGDEKKKLEEAVQKAHEVSALLDAVSLARQRHLTGACMPLSPTPFSSSTGVPLQQCHCESLSLPFPSRRIAC
jgi:uncharacterized OsmC-like protein